MDGPPRASQLHDATPMTHSLQIIEHSGPTNSELKLQHLRSVAPCVSELRMVLRELTLLQDRGCWVHALDVGCIDH